MTKPTEENTAGQVFKIRYTSRTTGTVLLTSHNTQTQLAVSEGGHDLTSSLRVQ